MVLQKRCFQMGSTKKSFWEKSIQGKGFGQVGFHLSGEPPCGQQPYFQAILLHCDASEKWAENGQKCLTLSQTVLEKTVPTNNHYFHFLHSSGSWKLWCPQTRALVYHYAPQSWAAECSFLIDSTQLRLAKWSCCTGQQSFVIKKSRHLCLLNFTHRHRPKF